MVGDEMRWGWHWCLWDDAKHARTDARTDGRTDLGDDEEGDVHLVLQELRDDALAVGDGPRHVPLDEDLAQARVHHAPHQQAVVAPHLCVCVLGWIYRLVKWVGGWQ